MCCKRLRCRRLNPVFLKTLLNSFTWQLCWNGVLGGKGRDWSSVRVFISHTSATFKDLVSVSSNNNYEMFVAMLCFTFCGVKWMLCGTDADFEFHSSAWRAKNALNLSFSILHRLIQKFHSYQCLSASLQFTFCRKCSSDLCADLNNVSGRLAWTLSTWHSQFLCAFCRLMLVLDD